MSQRRVPEPEPGRINQEFFGKPVGDTKNADGSYHVIRNTPVGGSLSGVYTLPPGYPYFEGTTLGVSEYGSNTTPGTVEGTVSLSNIPGHFYNQGPSVFLSSPQFNVTVPYELTLSIQNPYLDYTAAPFTTSGEVEISSGGSFVTSVEAPRSFDLLNDGGGGMQRVYPVLPRYSPSVYARVYFLGAVEFSFYSHGPQVRIERQNPQETVRSF